MYFKQKQTNTVLKIQHLKIKLVQSGDAKADSDIQVIHDKKTHILHYHSNLVDSWSDFS